MLEVFRTAKENTLVKVETIEKGCWISLISPTEEELNYIQNKLGVLPNFLRDPLDEEEKPRIDMEENQTLFIVDIPHMYEEEGSLRFETRPVGILITDDYFITVCLKESSVINHFRKEKLKGLYTFKKTRFTLQILFKTAKEYLKYLRHIDKSTNKAEKLLHKSMRNKELFKLLELEKSLVYFTTSLKSNEIVMEKLLRGKHIKMYEEDQDLLEDVIIENRQAIEMANIYSSILSGTMDAFASVISNNLNIVMKVLTSVTIVMTIPTMIASFYGMNVGLPLQNNPFAFIVILCISFVVSIMATFILFRKGMF